MGGPWFRCSWATAVEHTRRRIVPPATSLPGSGEARWHSLASVAARALDLRRSSHAKPSDRTTLSSVLSEEDTDDDRFTKALWRTTGADVDIEDLKIDVIHASTGEEALAWCQRHVADVLATDIRLPGQVDGWQIAERYREQDPGRSSTRRAFLAPHHAPSRQPDRTEALPSGGGKLPPMGLDSPHHHGLSTSCLHRRQDQDAHGTTGRP